MRTQPTLALPTKYSAGYLSALARSLVLSARLVLSLSVIASTVVLLSTPAQAQTTVPGKIPGQFAVSPSGAATYSIPIQVPPGIAGMQPKLSLEYNSQAGNGIMGMGWSLAGLSSITRCPQTIAQDGVRGVLKADLDDRFCLDGQRLTVVSGAYGAAGSEYRTEIESFSQVTAYGSAGSGPAYFVVKNKAGLTMLYGNTGDSVSITSTGTRITWGLTRITDITGNRLDVTYRPEYGNGITYPTRIEYAGNAVTFDYGSVARPDVVNGFNAGVSIKMNLSLKSIATLSVGSTTTVTKIQYTPSTNTQRSLVSSVQLCNGGGSNCLAATNFNWRDGGQGIAKTNNATAISGAAGWKSAFDIYPGDYNGDGITDLYLIHKTDFSEYFCAGPTIASANACVPAKPSSAPSNIYQGAKIKALAADFDGDGITDLLILKLNIFFDAPNPNIPRADYGTTLCKGSRVVNIWSNCSIGLTDLAGRFAAVYIPDMQIGDFNNDGINDVIFTTTQASLFCAGPILTTDKANCKIIQSGSNWVSQFSINSGDFNGDGVADIYLIGDAGNYFCPGPGVASTNNCAPVAGASGWKSAFSIYPGDYNGDGVQDLYLVSDTASYLCAGPGVTSANNCAPIAGASGWKSAFNIYPADYNGDGITDLVLIGAGDSYFCSGPNITSTNNCAPITGASGWKTAFNIYLGDYNGDGIADLILTSDGASYFTSGGNGTSDILSGVSDGTVNGKLVTSTPITKSPYTRDTTSVYPRIDLQIPLYVVSQVDTSNGVGGVNSVQYSYGGLKAEQGTGRGMLGFRWMQSKELSTDIESRTEFSQDWPYIGMPVKSETRLAGYGNAGLLKRATSTPACKIPQNAAACSNSPGNRYFPYIASSLEESWEINGGQALPTLTTSTQYGISPGDSQLWGDPLSITVSTSDGSSKVVANEYEPAIVTGGNWILGRLKKATVTSTSPTTNLGIGTVAGGVTVGLPPPTPPTPAQIKTAQSVLPAILSLLFED